MATSSTPPSSPRVLVVDDEPAVREICRRIISEMGLQVDAARDREEAWRFLSSAGVDLVLTDIRMGSLTDGVALTDEIKSRFPGTDVIIMTGNPSVETAVAGLKFGASDYIGKPFQPEHLRGVIRHCLERRRLRQDLDREKALKRELEDAYAELQKVERLKDAFLARINHELRTPVTVALMAAQVIEGRLADDQGRALWARLEKSIQNLRTIVEDLVLYAELTGKGFKLKKDATDLWGLVRELVERYQPLWQDRGLKVDLILKGEAQTAPADRELMRTAFKQLLLNAIRFNRNGGSIRIEGEFVDGRARIAFSDSGIGIPADQVRDLFDSFYQVAEHLTREMGGLGLGLATVRRIVEAHGGSVSVQSQVERGSTFSAMLPL